MNEVIKGYIARKDVFCDAFNFFLHKGEREIKPDSLQRIEMDDDYLNLLYDLQHMGVVAYCDDKTEYLLLCITEQVENTPRICVTYQGMLYDNQKKEKPVVSLVVYFGADEWNTPDTYQLFGEQVYPEKREIVETFKIDILPAFNVNAENKDKFDSSLWNVMMRSKEPQTDIEKVLEAEIKG